MGITLFGGESLVNVEIRPVFLVLCLALCSFSEGQSVPTEITNSDVIQMTKAGIADQTIILAIQHGPVRFDISPQGLIALKTAGVSDKVLDTIIASNSTTIPSRLDTGNTAAQALFEKVLSALGARDAVAAIHSVRWKAKETLSTEGKTTTLEREVVKIYPDSVSITLRSAAGSLQRQVITPDFNYRNSGSITTAVPASDLEVFREQLAFDTLYIAQHPHEFTVTGEGQPSSEGAEELTISKGGKSIVWTVDPQTGHILSYRLDLPSGAVVTDLSDWRVVEGVSVAFKRHLVGSGHTDDEAFTDYEVNPVIDEKPFQRPAQEVSQGMTLKVLQSQSVPYTQESGRGISTSCNIVGNANTSGYANSIGNNTFGSATTQSNQHMSCSSYDTTMRWPHVLNVMFAQASDGNSYIIACDRAWRWSKCVPLRAGDVFNARFTGKGIEVEAFNTKGKEQNPTYYVLQSKSAR